MNEVLVLNRLGDPDDGMFSCNTGTINGNGVKSIATFGEQRCVRNFVSAYIRKTGKAIEDYSSTEAVLLDFIGFLEQVLLEPVEEEE